MENKKLNFYKKKKLPKNILLLSIEGNLTQTHSHKKIVFSTEWFGCHNWIPLLQPQIRLLQPSSVVATEFWSFSNRIGSNLVETTNILLESIHRLLSSFNMSVFFCECTNMVFTWVHFIFRCESHLNMFITAIISYEIQLLHIH